VSVFPSFELRPATSADEDFLFALFLSSRELELPMLPEPQRQTLMRMQFRGQQLTYAQRYSPAEHNIVVIGGCEAGRVWVAETANGLLIVDIALLPQFRNHGIGTGFYNGMIERAREAGKPLWATVSTANAGSLRFHERLGFQRESSNGLYISMVKRG
jgi:GNAT superfamily N-acetyltransferase